MCFGQARSTEVGQCTRVVIDVAAAEHCECCLNIDGRLWKRTCVPPTSRRAVISNQFRQGAGRRVGRGLCPDESTEDFDNRRLVFGRVLGQALERVDTAESDVDLL